MALNNIVEQTLAYVKNHFADDKTGHDWQHIKRVYHVANYIAAKENADSFIVAMGALLHDLDDWKLNNNFQENNSPNSRAWLEQLNIDDATQDKILHIVSHVSFKGAKVANEMNSLDGKVVQDADRLDAMGAIGVSRAIIYGAVHNRDLYDPTVKATLHENFADYRKKQSTTMNHFHEKLFLLKDLMNTPTGKILAQRRHQTMVTFLEEFEYEWHFMDNCSP